MDHRVREIQRLKFFGALIIVAVTFFAMLAIGVSFLAIMATKAPAASVVTIVADDGGYVQTYVNRLTKYQDEGTLVRIVGRCASACTVYLGLPREQLCFSPTARIGFHAARALEAEW